jgi:hypothetical protein
MHNVDYDPGPKLETNIKIASAGEPGSPASQAGTLPIELSRQLIPELRFRDPGSGIQGSKRHGITCIKFASAGDRTRVACVTSGHST